MRLHPLLLALCTLSLTAASVVKAGEIEFYEYENYQGISTVLRGNVDNLESYPLVLNARSMRVRGTTWDLCTGPFFSGVCLSYRPGDYAKLSYDGKFSARELFPQAAPVQVNMTGRVELYEEPFFRGVSVVLDRNVPTLRVANFANRARSMIVASGTWEVCNRDSFAGRCTVFTPGRYNELNPEMARNINSLRLVQPAQAQYQQPPAIPQPQQPPPQQPQVINPVAAIAGALLGGIVQPNMTPPPVVNQVQPIQNGRIHFFTGPGFTGRSFSLVESMNDFGGTGFNDRVQSVRVESGSWELCQHANFAGECRVFGVGQFPILYNLDNAISSARIVTPPARGTVSASELDGLYPANTRNSNHAVMIFDQEEFRGDSYRANNDVLTLGGTSMNDRSRSILVRYGKWQFCEDRDFRGRCVTLTAGGYPRLNWELENKISSFRRVE
jgi:Beta/Gamma crystallin